MASNSTLLFLDLPPKTFLGIDLLSFDSSLDFHGITNIPAGFHFVYSGADSSLSIRHGRWLNIRSGASGQQTTVLKWKTDEESLTLLDSSSALARSAATSFESSGNAGVIDYTNLSDASANIQSKQSITQSDVTDWPRLTSYISSALLTRILTLTRTISSISSAPNDTESIPGLSHLESSAVLPDTHLNVTPINLKQTWPDDAIGRDRTDKARDRSWYLSHLIKSTSPSESRERGAKELLGELQFCYLMVLTLANYSCLEQWKRVLTVIMTCRQALSEVEGYFIEVLKVLQLQLRHVEDVDGGLFELRDDTSSAWLRQLLTRFGRNVEDMLGNGSKVGKELIQLQGYLRDTYGWEDEKDVLRRGTLELEDGERVEVSMDGVDEEEETGEYAPLVVET